MSIRILAFNTTTKLCSVALMIDNDIYYDSVMVCKSHSEKILPMIHQLLSKSGITLKSLDCIIFDRGPGSFVGVRIGIGVAQGLALGLDLPLVAVSSLAILAQAAKRLFCATRVITTIDAHMGKLYWANYCYCEVDGLWICQSNEFLVTEEMAQRLVNTLQGHWVLVGTGWNNYSCLKYITINDPIILRSIVLIEAQDMLPLGMDSWIKKEFITLHQVKPVYLYDMVALKRYK